jgi:hypothetical protein
MNPAGRVLNHGVMAEQLDALDARRGAHRYVSWQINPRRSWQVEEGWRSNRLLNL